MRDAALSSGSLRRRYMTGETTPAEVVDDVYARIHARGDDHVWLSLLDQDQARAAAEALDLDDLDNLPLFGIPFAVKDNIDVAGLPTTAACPDFAYAPTTTAPVVARLLAAGALVIGKTNLDQFATGLNGTRSPYGAPTSVHDPALIAGGSSSGSAVAVAAGLVSFAIGTDTAGSGRVPAALNGIVGIKPTLGLVSTTGLVPACRSLDCPSVFAPDVSTGSAVLHVIAGFDSTDPWSRRGAVPPAAPHPAHLEGLRIAVPERIEHWGGRGEQQAWDSVVRRLQGRGVTLVPLDLTDFLEAGDLLYGGPWVSERLASVQTFLDTNPAAALPEIHQVLSAGRDIAATAAFTAIDRLRTLRRNVELALAGVDALLTPTVVETFTLDEMRANPITLNSRLGRYTTFTNLLDLAAVALPARDDEGEAPFGVTLHHLDGTDARLTAIALAIESRPSDPASTPATAAGDFLDLAVVGAHLSGMPLHPELLRHEAVLVQRTTTSTDYRLYALVDDPLRRPGLKRVQHDGHAIDVEVYRLPRTRVGDFLATVTTPLAIGQITLADARTVHGFVCEPHALEHATDVTAFGGWRAFTKGSR